MRKRRNSITLHGPGPVLRRVLAGIEQKGYELTIRGTNELHSVGISHSDKEGQGALTGAAPPRRPLQREGASP